MQLAKQCFLLLILATAALFMPHAKAACTSPNIPTTLSLASISVSTTLTVGSTIPGTEQTVPVTGNCANAYNAGLPIIACYYGSGSEVPGLTGVYSSGVPGIGVALKNDKGQRITGAGGIYCNSTSTPLGYVSTDGSLSFNFNVTLELVKTSDTVTAGTLQVSQTVFGVGVYQHDAVGNPNEISYAGNVTIKQVTCNVSPKSFTVPMGNIPLTNFTAPGKLSPGKVFDVSMTCDTTVEPQVMVTSGNGYETNYPGVIKLTPESGVASGVGVRILNNGQPAAFGVYTTTSSPAYANIAYLIPFTFAYQQVSPEVTPGVANAVATITLGYK